MRIKYARLAKLFGIVVVFLFVVPYFVGDLDRSSQKRYKSRDDDEHIVKIDDVERPKSDAAEKRQEQEVRFS